MIKDGGRHGPEEEVQGQRSAGICLREKQEESKGAHPRTGIGIGLRREDP